MIRTSGLPLICKQSKGRGSHYLRSVTRSPVWSSARSSVNLTTVARVSVAAEIENDEIRTSLQSTLPGLLPPLKSNVLSESSNAGMPVTSSFVSRLAELNGFRQINLDPDGFVQLAEGVVAEPQDRKTFDQHYVMYTRLASARAKEEEQKKKKTDSDQESVIFSLSLERFRGTATTAETPPKPEVLPPFREEDYSLYRLVQSSLEDNINRREERLRTYLRYKFDQAQESYRSLEKGVNRPIAWLTGRSLKSENDELKHGEGKVEVIDQASPEDIPLEAPVTRESEVLEDLLIYSNFDGKTGISLLQDVPSQFRLLALPTNAYRLRHGRAATLIYTGLVSFAAAPLAYRSLKYAMDYPSLAQALIASVIGSVSYSLWSSRHGARTRQMLVVTTASMSRLVAKDNAALCALQERRWLVDAVIDEYLKGLNSQASGEDAADGAPSSSIPGNDDSIKLARELGLLERDMRGKLVAVAWNDCKLNRQAPDTYVEEKTPRHDAA